MDILGPVSKGSPTNVQRGLDRVMGLWYKRGMEVAVRPIEFTIRVKGKRPDYATPSYVRHLRQKGMRVVDIAAELGITRSQVYNILKQP